MGSPIDFNSPKQSRQVLKVGNSGSYSHRMLSDSPFLFIFTTRKANIGGVSVGAFSDGGIPIWIREIGTSLPTLPHFLRRVCLYWIRDKAFTQDGDILRIHNQKETQAKYTKGESQQSIEMDSNCLFSLSSQSFKMRIISSNLEMIKWEVY